MIPLRRNGLVFLAVVAVASLAYAAHEVASISETERLLGRVYDRQIEAILYAINQNAWDVAETWATRAEVALVEAGGQADRAAGALQPLFARNGAIEAVVVADTAFGGARVVGRAGAPPPALSPAHRAALAHAAAQVRRRLRAGYRQVLPVPLPGAGADTTRLGLVFPLREPVGAVGAAALLVDVPTFAADVLGPKLDEVSRDSLGVALFRGDVPVRTAGPPLGAAVRRRAVWVLPAYTVGIATQSDTLARLARRRYYRSLALLVALALGVTGSAWFFYRNVRREADLARIKADFLANVSHELRTPLALIHMYAETLEMGRVRSDAQRLDYYRIITHETERLSRLVNNLLDFSRIEAGRKVYRMAPVDVTDVVEGVVGLYRPTLERDGFTVSTAFAPDLPSIHADAEALSEAVLNLLDNARKYSRDRRAVAVRTGADAEGVFVEVADEGIGITREDQARIFEKFFRVSTGLVHTVQGTGLGLSLVRHIVEAHGGRIRLESTPGAGSRFRLVFPPAPQPVAAS